MEKVSAMEKFSYLFDAAYEHFSKSEKYDFRQGVFMEAHYALMSVSKQYKAKVYKFISWRGDLMVTDVECAAFFAAYNKVEFANA